MSVSDYLSTYFLPHWITYPGLLGTTDVCDIARKLQIASEVRAVRRYAGVSDWFHTEKRKILVQSEIDLDHGKTDPKCHCSVLIDIRDTHFEIWTPYADGKDGTEKRLKADWDDKSCFGLVLV